MFKNRQRPKGPLPSDGQQLHVHSIFPTIQGEGPFSGRAAVFLRLADCNLQCPLCDTDYTGGRGVMDAGEVFDEIASHGRSLCVITGGEPFRQNLDIIVANLHTHGIQVQIETNGMLEPQGSLWTHATIVIAPKTHRLNPQLVERAAAFKYVLRAGDLAPDGLPVSALNHPLPAGKMLARPPVGWEGPIYVQPADEGDFFVNAENLNAAIRAVEQHPRYTLCLQIHKIIGVD